VPSPDSLFANGKLPLFIVGQQLWEGDTSVSDTASLEITPLIQTGDNKYEHHPLSVGETGSFPAGMMGNLAGELLITIGMGSLIVDEFTDLVFRANYNATMCRLKGWNPEKPCPKPIPVKGKIVKAFAGTRLPGNLMLIERTPGTEMYRKAAERALSEWSTSTSESASSPGSESTAPGTSDSAGGTIGDCVCTCEEREQTILLGEGVKARTEAGEEVAAGEIMSLMRCSTTCRREYMICIMEEDEREKEAEEALLKKQAKPTEECDCGCDALAKFTRKREQFEAEFKPGDMSQMDEIMSMTTCFQTCMSEFMNCQQ